MGEFLNFLGKLEDASTRAESVFGPLLRARGIEPVNTTNREERIALLAKYFQGAKEIFAAVDGEEVDDTIEAAIRAGLLTPGQVTIRITKSPAGSAPEYVREEWADVTLPAFPLTEMAGDRDLISGQEMPPRKSYAVLTTDAIEALRSKSPEAAVWFRDNLSPEYTLLTFGEDEAEVVNS